MTAAPPLTSLSTSARGPGKTVSSHDQIVRSLGQDILAGRIAPGDKLPGEADLLNRFGVSRTALREALKTLSAKGFLVVKTRVGTKVTDPLRWNLFDSEVLAWQVANGMDARFRRHLAEVRRALEPAAAALAARHRGVEDLAGMRAAVEAMRREQQSEHGFAQADLNLHLRIAAASGNPLMRSLASVIETALLEAFTLSPPTRSPVLHRETVDLHERIVDHIESGNASAAAAAMLAVIDAGYRRVEAEKDAG
ncbi:FadR family transcriptional regulator [Brevundimonas sp. AJA228-03]|uniref:FadR/GntR family transcriptional regulator n=1 Tax=Brevundimonas sp. AJA228-03 TaxID=2752515 RepID=UPI001ADF95FD|nr:FadR/GntR family transcriptional regulator [Brevundimonas sp. AJA228-03]QTN20452.1 FadR family transcriptional regulator [Brevundimonas sp. AJA228-03]